MQQTPVHKKTIATKKPQADSPSLFQITLLALLMLAGCEMLREFLTFSSPWIGQVLTVGVGTVIAVLAAVLARRGSAEVREKFGEVTAARQRVEGMYQTLLERARHLEVAK